MKRLVTFFMLIVLALVIAPVAAQEFIVLDENKLGTIDAANPSPGYIFAAQAGQEINVEVLAIGAGVFPQFTVLDQNGALVTAVGNPTQQTTITGTVKFPTAGNFTIQVSAPGGAGQFVLTLRSAVPAIPPTPLAEGQTAAGTLNASGSITYTFVANPNTLQVLDIGGTNATQGVSVELKDPSGKTIATLNSLLLGSSFVLPPGNGNYLVTLKNDLPDVPSLTYEITLVALDSSEILESGQPELPTTGACVLATFNPSEVNVRSGPSTDFDPPIATLLPTEIYAVIGKNADSSWYQVTYTGGSGWVAAQVTRRGGDCRNVPVTAQQTTSPQATQAATEQATEQATQDVTPEATEQATQEATEEPTQEATEEQNGQAQIAGDNEYNGVEINIKNDSKAFSGYVSYPNGDTHDTVAYNVTGFDSVTTSGNVTITAVCTGSGSENARVNFNSAQASGGVPCNGASTTIFHTTDSNLGWATVYLESGDGAYVNWTLIFSASN